MVLLKFTVIYLVGLLLSSFAFASTPDVFEPAASANATVVFFHGGAWQGGDKAQYASLAKTFTSHGIRFVSANYRLSSEAAHPAPVDDLEALLGRSQWDNVYLMGHSAGAHLIAIWNSSHTSSRVRGFIGIEGIYDIPALIKKWPSYKDAFIAKEFGAADKWPAASPTLLPVKSKKPWLVIHSSKDELVDLAQSSNFVAHLKKLDVPATLVTLPSDTHFGAIESVGNSSSESAKAILKFLKAP